MEVCSARARTDLVKYGSLAVLLIEYVTVGDDGLIVVAADD